MKSNTVLHPTMFKIPNRKPDRWGHVFKADRVECQHCKVTFPLGDLLDGELNENSCPSCGVTSPQYYGGVKNA